MVAGHGQSPSSGRKTTATVSASLARRRFHSILATSAKHGLLREVPSRNLFEDSRSDEAHHLFWWPLFLPRYVIWMPSGPSVLIVKELLHLRLVLRSHLLSLCSVTLSIHSRSSCLLPVTKNFSIFMSHNPRSWRVDEENTEPDSGCPSRKISSLEMYKPRVTGEAFQWLGYCAANLPRSRHWRTMLLCSTPSLLWQVIIFATTRNFCVPLSTALSGSCKLSGENPEISYRPKRYLAAELLSGESWIVPRIFRLREDFYTSSRNSNPKRTSPTALLPSRRRMRTPPCAAAAHSLGRTQAISWL